jgi:hypothetical protein
LIPYRNQGRDLYRYSETEYRKSIILITVSFLYAADNEIENGMKEVTNRVVSKFMKELEKSVQKSDVFLNVPNFVAKEAGLVLRQINCIIWE